MKPAPFACPRGCWRFDAESQDGGLCPLQPLVSGGSAQSKVLGNKFLKYFNLLGQLFGPASTRSQERDFPGVVKLIYLWQSLHRGKEVPPNMGGRHECRIAGVGDYLKLDRSEVSLPDVPIE